MRSWNAVQPAREKHSDHSTLKATISVTWTANLGLTASAIFSGRGASSCPTAIRTIRLNARQSARLGNSKNALFRELVAQKGVEVFDGSVAFIRTLRKAGLKTALVSASKNTGPILNAAGLANLFDVRVDGVEAGRLGLKGKPSPDTFLYAAKLLGVSPGRAFGVEDSLAGVEAIRAAGFGLVIGVDRSGQARGARGAWRRYHRVGSRRAAGAHERARRAGTRA